MVVLVGFPSDEGVKRNDGRPGAAGGPAAIRRWLYRFTPSAIELESFVDLIGRTVDLGDLAVSGDVECDQAALGELLAPYIGGEAFVIVLGGGHETAFGHFLGYVVAEESVAIVNWDSDVDVRELKEGRAHSGSPFRQALLHPSGYCRLYTVAGLLPYSAAAAHLDFVAEHGGRHFWGPDLTADRVVGIYREMEAPSLVTFDLDAVDQASAPGVSAPAISGMPAGLWLHAAHQAGACPAVRSCDIVELNPAYDRDGQTAKLAALTVFEVLRGLARRFAR